MAKTMLGRITRDDVEAALDTIRKAGAPARRRSTKFCLVVNLLHYPPRYVMQLAARQARRRAGHSREYSGAANRLLDALGYDVVVCGCGGEGTFAISNPPGIV